MLLAGTERAGVAPDLPWRGRSELLAKRVMDVTIALVVLIGTTPLLLLIALLIVADSRGPVLFAQPRVGARPRWRGGRIEWEVCEFRMLKFRTMVRNADESPLHAEFIRAFVAGEIVPGSNGGMAYKLVHDARITRLGRWLRRTSLDELPQLLNVITGRMSLVGPRPVPPYEVAGYAQRHMARLAALPGMTGAWQVDGRGRTSFEQMVHMDVEYVRRRSLRLDLWLLLRTIPSVLSRKGAR